VVVTKAGGFCIMICYHIATSLSVFHERVPLNNKDE
jgi:hypothetical protein